MKFSLLALFDIQGAIVFLCLALFFISEFITSLFKPFGNESTRCRMLGAYFELSAYARGHIIMHCYFKHPCVTSKSWSSCNCSLTIWAMRWSHCSSNAFRLLDLRYSVPPLRVVSSFEYIYLHLKRQLATFDRLAGITSIYYCNATTLFNHIEALQNSVCIYAWSWLRPM
jgi:hypothetical protein